jgi:hypothetical protein
MLKQVVDSSGWIEVFTNGGQEQAVQAAAVMQCAQVVVLTAGWHWRQPSSAMLCSCRWRTASSWPRPGISEPGCIPWTASFRASPMWSGSARRNRNLTIKLFSIAEHQPH